MIEHLVQKMVRQENQMITNHKNNLNHNSRKIWYHLSSIIQFSQDYNISETLMREALNDIELTKLKADQRKKKQSDIKTKENDMAYTDFDWKSLCKDKKIVSLTAYVGTLYRYLKEKNLLPEGCITNKENVALVLKQTLPPWSGQSCCKWNLSSFGN